MSRKRSRENAMRLIRAYSGQDKVIAIPRVYIDLTGDYVAAALLNQILYWSERTKDAQGWFYKSYSEWEDELGISEYQVRRSIKGDKRSSKRVSLESLGVETALRKAPNGAPTLHYRIDDDVFVGALLGHLEKSDPSVANLDIVDNPTLNNVEDGNQTMSSNDSKQTQESIYTESTTESTTLSADAEAPPAPPASETVAQDDDTPNTSDDSPDDDDTSGGHGLSGDELTQYLACIENGLGISGRRRWDVLHQLRGSISKDRKHIKRYQYGELFRDEPATLAEMRQFPAWYRKRNGADVNMPTSADALEDWFGKFRAVNNQSEKRRKQLTDIRALPAPPTLNLGVDDGVVTFNKPDTDEKESA